MKTRQKKFRPSYLLIVPAILAIALGIHFFSKEGVSIAGYVGGFFRELLGGGKSLWEQIVVASLLIGLGNALLVPISALLVATAVFLPGWPAFGACMLGSLMAAGIGYVYGFFVDDSYLKEKLGKKYELAVAEVSADGLKSVVVLCFAPIAPNLLTNIIAGVCRIRLWKLMVGTFIGFLPGVVILTLMGRKIRQMVEEPGYQTGFWIAALGALFFLVYKISKRVQKRMARREGLDES